MTADGGTTLFSRPRELSTSSTLPSASRRAKEQLHGVWKREADYSGCWIRNRHGGRHHRQKIDPRNLDSYSSYE
ncbi:MAG: hypothetical protein ACK56F_07585 [bacterium]